MEGEIQSGWRWSSGLKEMAVEMKDGEVAGVCGWPAVDGVIAAVVEVGMVDRHSLEREAEDRVAIEIADKTVIPASGFGQGGCDDRSDGPAPAAV